MRFVLFKWESEKKMQKTAIKSSTKLWICTKIDRFVLKKKARNFFCAYVNCFSCLCTINRKISTTVTLIRYQWQSCTTFVSYLNVPFHWCVSYIYIKQTIPNYTDKKKLSTKLIVNGFNHVPLKYVVNCMCNATCICQRCWQSSNGI